jgi:pimeloyl-ACP methyl ester carboxylesterase
MVAGALFTVRSQIANVWQEKCTSAVTASAPPSLWQPWLTTDSKHNGECAQFVPQLVTQRCNRFNQLHLLPCRLQHIVAATGRGKVHYIGHSQGSTIALAALAQEETSQRIIGSAILLAPAAFASHTGSLLLRALAGLQADRCAPWLSPCFLLSTVLRALSRVHSGRHSFMRLW